MKKLITEYKNVLTLTILTTLTAFTVTLSAQSESSTACGILDSITYYTAHDLPKDTYLRAVRCILSLPDRDILINNVDSFAFIAPKLAYYNEIGLLESITTKLLPYAKKRQTRYKLIRSSADLARKQLEWLKADSLYNESFKEATTDYEKAISLLYSGYSAAISGEDIRAKDQYASGMENIKNIDSLDNDEYFGIFNLSAALNTYIGSQDIAASNYLKLFSNKKLSNHYRASAAHNLIDLYVGNNLCDSARLLSHYARINLNPSVNRNHMYWQLMRCDGKQGFRDSIEIHFNAIVSDTTANGRFIQQFILADYYAATNKGNKILPIIQTYKRDNPSDLANLQYLTFQYVTSFLNKSNPESDQIIEEFLHIRDSLSGEKLDKNLAESQVALDFRISESESKSLNQELNFSEHRSKSRMLLALSLGLGLLLTFILYFKLKKQKEKLSDSNQKITFLNQELNHRTANQISLAYELILDQRRQIGDEQAKASLSRSESQLMALREVNRALAHRSDDLVRADEVLTKVAKNLQAASPYPFELDLQLKAISIHGNAASRSALILSELISNSIKYAFPNTEDAKATVFISQTKSGTTISYHDNGPGSDGTVRGTGVGSGLIEAMLEDLDAEFERGNNPDGEGYGMRWWW